jgi:hypothetical protein
MSAADIAQALGDAHREGRGWRCRCALHQGRRLTLRDGDGGWVIVTCWGGLRRHRRTMRHDISGSRLDYMEG